MAVLVSLQDDEALVLFELPARGHLDERLDAPERNALWALEALLEKQLTAPFAVDYPKLLELARASLLDRYGD